jgi:hypothetical protein
MPRHWSYLGLLVWIRAAGYGSTHIVLISSPIRDGVRRTGLEGDASLSKFPFQEGTAIPRVSNKCIHSISRPALDSFACPEELDSLISWTRTNSPLTTNRTCNLCLDRERHSSRQKHKHHSLFRLRVDQQKLRQSAEFKELWECNVSPHECRVYQWMTTKNKLENCPFVLLTSISDLVGLIVSGVIAIPAFVIFINPSSLSRISNARLSLKLLDRAQPGSLERIDL